MKLYHSPTSPFVRKVMVTLHETGQLDDVELEGAAGTAIEPGTMPLVQNPLGKVPALERTDGPAIYDSRVICRFLDDRAGSGLYPTGKRQWDVLTIEATADGIMEACVLMTYEQRIRPIEKQFDAWIEGQWSKASRAIAALNTRWISHLEGPMHIGQIAVACALGYVDFRASDRDWRKGNDSLADWYNRFAERESMRTTVPPS